MARKLDEAIGNTLKAHGFGPDAVWDCHGVWVVYHRVLEKIAAKVGIVFDAPTIIEANSAEKVAALCVTGEMGKQREWSIGEASPLNYQTKGNQPAYPWAMAEKRAKDRVILKLIGLHGMVYSEEEADSFKSPDRGQMHGPLNITELKKACRDFSADLAACDDYDTLVGLLKSSEGVIEQMQRDLPDWWFGVAGSDVEGAQARIDARRVELADKDNTLRA